MKKLLGILVLGLLLSSNAYAEKIVFSSKDFIIVHYKSLAEQAKYGPNSDGQSMPTEPIPIPSIAKNYCKSLDKNTYLLGFAPKKRKYKALWENAPLDYMHNVLGTWQRVRWFCAKNKEEAHEKFRDVMLTNKFGKVKFKSVLVNYQKYHGYDLHNGNFIWATDDKNAKTILEERKSEAKANTPEQKKKDLASMINEAKKTCKELGFEEGTEKFADCGLKLYSQSVELAAKNNQQVVMGPQSSGSNTMTIYDPRRDSRILMKKAQRMLSGRCTFGIDC